MKNLLFANLMPLLAAASIAVAQSQPSTKPIQPFNETKKWTYPYTANQERAKKIIEGALVKTRVPFQEVIDKLGNPDAVQDLRKPFEGLSRSEYDFVMEVRSKISYRMIWYVSKQGTRPHYKDIWLAVYVGTDEKTVVGALGANIPK